MTTDHSVIDPRRGVVGIYPSREHADRAKSSFSGAYPDRDYRTVLTTPAHRRGLEQRTLACLAWRRPTLANAVL